MNRRALWTAADAGAACRGALQDTLGRSSENWIATGVSIDTRTLVEGDLFVALRGDNRNGDEFAPTAFQAGAAAALVQSIVPGASETAPYIVADDTLKALRDLAFAARNRARAKRIAVTGSVGKTSVKEMLREALQAVGRTHASEKSYNNHWGVPLTLARMPQDADYGVFEIGMNHSGEIEPLTRLVQPDVAIITTVGAAHLEFFHSVDEIAEAKAEIFDGLNGGVAVINRDNPYFEFLKSQALERGAREVLFFGRQPNSDIRLTDVAARKDGAHLQVQVRGRKIEYDLGLTGDHQALNSLAVVAGLVGLGAPLGPALKAFASMGAVVGRGATFAVNKSDGAFTVIDESYNANPISMRAALKLLADTAPEKGGRRVAVLGDMLELGESSSALHAALKEPLVSGGIDAVFLCGVQMARLRDALPLEMCIAYEESSQDLVVALADYVRSGDVVMIKGSLSARMAVVVDALKTQNESPEACGEGTMR